MNQAILEWWQLILLSAAGGALGSIIALAATMLQHVLTSRATRHAEQRGNARRLEEEERHERRQYRRERVQPISDYLAKRQAYIARSRREDVLRGLDAIMEEHKGQFAANLGVSAAQIETAYRQEGRPKWGGPEHSVDILFDLFESLCSALDSAPSQDVERALVETLRELAQEKYEGATASRLADLVQDYIVMGIV